MEPFEEGGSLPPEHHSVPDGKQGSDGLCWAEHERLLDALSVSFHMRSSWERQMMKEVVRLHEAGTCLELGFESVQGLVSTWLCIGYRRASELVEVALCLPHLPQISSSYEKGEIGYDHLRALVKVAGPANESALLDAIKGMSVSDTFHLVQKITKVSKEQAVDARMQRHFEMRWDNETRMLYIWGQLPEDLGARFEKAIDAFAKQMPEDPLFEGRTPRSVKRADALLELAASPACGNGLDAGSTVVVHVDAETLATGDGAAQIENGPAVGPETVRRLLCDSRLETVIDGSDGKPVRFGRSRRTAPPRLKQELRRRDRTCRWPGCRRRKLVEAHHIDGWKDWGSTDYDNLVLFCSLHHFLVHEGEYTVRGEPPSITIVPPKPKTEIRYGPPPRPDGVNEMFGMEIDIHLRGPDPPDPSRLSC